MKKLIGILVFILVLILNVNPVFAPAPTPEIDDYQISFVGVVYDEPAGTSTWTYDVTCIGDPEISHFDFEFKTICDPPLESIIDAGPGDWEIVDPDPTTGVTGLKFDIPVLKGETLRVWFTLEGLWDVNDMQVWIKAGNQDPYDGPWYLPEGPSCFVIPEVPLGTASVLLAAFVGVALVTRKKSTKN